MVAATKPRGGIAFPTVTATDLALLDAAHEDDEQAPEVPAYEPVEPVRFCMDEQGSMRVYLPKLSNRQKPARVPDEMIMSWRNGSLYKEEYAQFHLGAFISDNPAVIAELRRLIRTNKLAGCYEDSDVTSFRAPDGYTTRNEAQFHRYMAQSKAGLPKPISDPANDPL